MTCYLRINFQLLKCIIFPLMNFSGPESNSGFMFDLVSMFPGFLQSVKALWSCCSFPDFETFKETEPIIYRIFFKFHLSHVSHNSPFMIMFLR
jgi:hypothetical protein